MMVIKNLYIKFIILSMSKYKIADMGLCVSDILYIDYLIFYAPFLISNPIKSQNQFYAIELRTDQTKSCIPSCSTRQVGR